MNMFMIFKRKQMILTALVLMLGIAGYLNYRYDKDAKKQIASIENAEITEPGVGETVMVSSEGSPSPDKKSDVKDPFAAHKLRRDAAREKTKEELNNLLANEDLSPDMKEETRRKLTEISEFGDKEVTAENLLSAKGFEHTMVYITEESVTVTVKRQGISRSDTAKIVDIIFELTQNNNVKIVEVE